MKYLACFILLLSPVFADDINTQLQGSLKEMEGLNSRMGLEKAYESSCSDCSHKEVKPAMKHRDDYVKVFDGMSAKCRNFYDYERYKRGGIYYLSKPAISSTSTEQISFDASIIFMECKKVGRKEFKMGMMDDPYNYSFQHWTFDKGGAKEVTRWIEKKKINVTANRDGIYKYSDGEISQSDKSKHLYKSKVDVKLTDIMSKKEHADFMAGKEVKLSVDFRQTGLKAFKKSKDDITTHADYFKGGAYRYHFKIKKLPDGTVKVN
jgi:hypothetical protein